MAFLSKCSFKLIVVIFTLVAVTVSSSLIGTLLQINIDETSTIFQESSSTMVNRASMNFMQFSNLLYKRRLQQILQQNSITLMTFQLLYDYIQNNKIQFQATPQECLYSQYIDSYNSKTGFCYMIPKSETTSDEHLSDTFTLISLLNQFILGIQEQNMSYLYYISHEQGGLYFEYPTYIEDGNIYSDQPFLNNTIYNFTPPLLERDGYPLSTISFRKLTNKDGSYQGILARDFILQEFNRYNNLHNYIMSDQGLIVREGSYHTYDLPYIYNETITGFNYLDWINLQNNTQVTMYNSLLESEVIVNIIYLSKYCLRLIMFEDIRHYKKQAQTIIYQLEQWRQDNNQLSFMLFFLGGVLVISIQILILSYLLSPLYSIVNIICKNWLNHSLEMQKNYLLLKVSRKKIYQVQVFKFLLRSIERKARTARYKSVICRQIERLSYPHQVHFVKKNRFSYQIDQLQDTQEE